MAQIEALRQAGAEIVRIAVDSPRDAEALIEIRAQTTANLAVDLQENYRLAERVAPHVDKIRYNPGHLYHHERTKPWQAKVEYLANVAREHDCALRVGVNCGSVDPAKMTAGTVDPIAPMVASALEHCELLDAMGFTRYCVSLKDSDPQQVIAANRRFAAARPDVPLHLGVTEAGMPPEGVLKTRLAFEQLIGTGIGDTVRVSLTVPNDRKVEEIEAARQIIADIAAGRVRSVVRPDRPGLNIISCPSCSRVENEAFIELAQQVRDMTQYAAEHAHDDRRDGVPREWPWRDGRRRSRTLVWAHLRPPKTRTPHCWQLPLSTRSSTGSGTNSTGCWPHGRNGPSSGGTPVEPTDRQARPWIRGRCTSAIFDDEGRTLPFL